MENKQKTTNLNYLIGLSKGDKNFVRKMITVFLEENPKELSSLEIGIKEENYDFIKCSAHKLKSTIPFVGLDMLIGSEITEIESLGGKKTGIEKIRTHFQKVKESFDAACSELKIFLKEN